MAERTRPTEDFALRQAYRAGRRTHRHLDLPYGLYAAGALNSQVPANPSDYYLARACDAGVDGAWERLQTTMNDPLRAFLCKRGASATDAAQLLAEAWGALASPPPRGNANTRIGTYDGRGSLRAWLATILWRRLADRWRARSREAPLEGDLSSRSASAPDPADRAAQAEAARRLGAVLEKAWQQLTNRELHAMLLKYRYQLPQTEIARTMGIGPPRVTRILQSATTRLRTALAGECAGQPGTGASGEGWAGLTRTIEYMLARSAAELDGPERGRSQRD